MSVCAEFAEHVWKPGSCKNCFHPRSAHRPTGSACVSDLIVEDEDEVTSPSPYSKPTIAVRPTMMNMDPTADITMNMDQESQISSVGLRKTLDLAPLYIDSNRCHKTLQETIIQNTISGKKEYCSKFSSKLCSSTGFSKDCMIINNNMFVGEEDVSLRENRDGVSCRPQAKAVRSSYGNGDSCLHSLPQRHPSTANRDGGNPTSPGEETQVPLGITRTVPENGLNRTLKETPGTSPSSTIINDCLSGLPSNCSSVDSLMGLLNPQNLPDLGRNVPANRLEENEPIYAESTKRNRRTQGDGKTQQTEVSEGQRATITVMAAHTEENNRTFYLSSPDSAVSTQWSHFSPTATKDPFSPAFTWPNAPDNTELTSNPSVQPNPQFSPPVPPKINICTSRHGTSSLSEVALPELSFYVVLPPKETYAPSQGEAQLEQILLRSHSTRSLEGCIDEVDEEVEFKEGAAQRTDSGCRAGDPINGPAVREPDEWSEGRTTPGTNDNKSSSQTQAGVPVDEKESVLIRVLTTSSPVILSSEINTEKADGRDPVPPPPPPKKHHRVCNRMSGSNMDLDGISHRGSVENLNQSLRGLHCSTNASADSLHALSDADSTLRSCSSPFPSSVLASGPASPRADMFPSNSLVYQLQPPPLPQKKLVNRTVSAPQPPLLFSGLETNCDANGPLRSCPSALGPQCSSSESLKCCPPLRSRTLDDPQFRGQGRLGGHSRGSITCSSSPQLNTLLSVTPAAAAGAALQLQALLSNMDSREGIYSKLGGLYAESLRRLALKCEEHFTSGQRNPLRFNESNWSLFKLTCNKPSCLSGDAVYYSASCGSDPRNTYAVKICKSQMSDSKRSHLYGLSVQQSLPSHFNLQQDCGHFIACVPQSMLPNEGNLSRIAGPAEQERVVVITREVPHQSGTDFVKEWESFHQAQPEVYERRICFLLLQLCTGLEHLKAHGVTHRDLCLENLLLVQHLCSSTADGLHPDPQQQCLPRLLISNFTKAKQRTEDNEMVCVDPRLKRDHARLAPEIVSAAQYWKFDEFQTGILIYELLHQRNPFEATPALRQQAYKCEDLPSIPSMSIYSAGLQRLAHLLLEPDPSKRIHIQDAKRVLQGLLWGPRRDLLEQPWVYGGGAQRGVKQAIHEGLLNWLDVKRALLMMKFAERSLEPERNAELEDWLPKNFFGT